MAEETPSGPKTASRVAGVVAIAAILVGGYYGLVAKPASTTATSSDAATADAGSAPQPAPAANTAAKPAEGAPTEAAAPATAGPQAAEAGGEAAAPAEHAAPSFDIVRVEPTGETVVAGVATPGAKVELLDGALPIATAEANERGEWAMAVETPLSPGTHDLSIRTTSADKKVETLSEQRVAVHVEEPGKGEALVVLNMPDAASKVLQKPEASAEAQVAAAPSQPVAPKPAEPTTANPEATPKADEPVRADTLAESDKVASPDAPAGSAETRTAEAAAASAAGEPQVTVDAVEVEKGKMFVAGSAKTNAPVRVYVDEKLVGTAKPGEGGRWLLETPQAIEPGRRIVRADQLENGSGKVMARAEVPFERSADETALVPVAAGGGAGGASGAGNMPAPQNVIIRRGDNLWSISRRLYGRGIRFSTIYEANNDQIRNPHLIYPGQTFVLPTGDANWTN